MIYSYAKLEKRIIFSTVFPAFFFTNNRIRGSSRYKMLELSATKQQTAFFDEIFCRLVHPIKIFTLLLQVIVDALLECPIRKLTLNIIRKTNN